MNGQPSAAQKRFHEWCRNYGCILTREDYPDIHHIKGSKMKLKGVSGAGEWYILPLINHIHSNQSNPDALHTNKKSFVKRWGENEKYIWVVLIQEYEEENGHKPMGEIEYQIILERA